MSSTMAVRSNDSSLASARKHSKSGRHVAFSDVGTMEGGRRDSDSPCIQGRDKGRSEPRCFRCCACCCLSMLCILLLGLLLASSLVFLLQSELPRISVGSCAITSINATNAQVDGKPALLTDLGTSVMLNVTNRNSKVILTFGPLKANVSWEDIGMGQVKFVGFSQDWNLVSKLEVSTRVTNITLDKDDVEQLRKEMVQRNTVLTVVLTGTVGVQVGWLQVQRLPLLIRCSDISQAAIEVGQDYQCGVRIYAFS